MKRVCTAILAAALAAGCGSGEEKKPAAKPDTSVTARATTAPAALAYQEVRMGANVYVVGSADAARAAAAGKLKNPVRAVGYGAPGEKVFFDAANEDALRREYEKRHPAR